MSSAEIKSLRDSGQLKEALEMAFNEFKDDRENRGARLNLAWVLMDYLKKCNSVKFLEPCKEILLKIKALGIHPNDRVVYDTICWRLSKLAFDLSQSKEGMAKAYDLFLEFKDIPFPKPSKSYSFLFVSMHRCLKDSTRYLEFADWWDFANFLPEDHGKKTLDTGERMLSIAEQAYLNYFRHLTRPFSNEKDFKIDTSKLKSFGSSLLKLYKTHPEHETIPYLAAKSYLLIGDKAKAIKTILPVAKRNRNNVSIWKLLAECMEDEETLRIAFLCRALALNSPEMHKRNCRIMLAEKLAERQMYDEARTEIELAIGPSENRKVRSSKKINDFLSKPWYLFAKNLGDNEEMYKQYFFEADGFLDGDLGMHTVAVEFVNRKRKILHFVARGEIGGFLKYGRLIPSVSIGDVLDIRFKGTIKNGQNQALSIVPSPDGSKGREFFRPMKGVLKSRSEDGAGRVGNVFVNARTIRSYHLSEGMKVEGTAIRYFDKTSGEFGWKALTLKSTG